MLSNLLNFQYFKKYEKANMIFSSILLIFSFICMMLFSFKNSMDFHGGGSIGISIEDIDKFQKSLDQYMIKNNIHIEFSKRIYTDIVNIEISYEHLDAVVLILENENIIIQKKVIIGPKMGKALIKYAILSSFFIILGVMTCIWIQFGNSFSIAAILALAHDAFISLGFISLMGISFDLSCVASILTIIGYSINDTIVVFNRLKIHEYTQDYDIPIREVISRSIATTITTSIALICMLFVPDPNINRFAIVTLFGIIIGTYSSIYFATPIALKMYSKYK